MGGVGRWPAACIWKGGGSRVGRWYAACITALLPLLPARRPLGSRHHRAAPGSGRDARFLLSDSTAPSLPAAAARGARRRRSRPCAAE